MLQTGKWRLDDAVSLVVCSFWYKFEDFEVMAPLFMCFVLGSILFPPSLEFFVFCKCDLERDGSVLHWYQRTCTWFLKAESRQRQIALLLQRCLVASSSWDRAFRRRENLNKFEKIYLYEEHIGYGLLRAVNSPCFSVCLWTSLLHSYWHLLCPMGCTSQGLLGDARPYLVNLPVPVQWAKLLVRASWETAGQSQKTPSNLYYIRRNV